MDIRAWVIINTLLATGIRAKETRDLKISDINMDGGYITLNTTKNKQARVIPIPSTLFVIFTEWLRIRNASSGTKRNYVVGKFDENKSSEIKKYGQIRDYS